MTLVERKYRRILAALGAATLSALGGMLAAAISLKFFFEAFYNTLQSSYEIDVPDSWEVLFFVFFAVSLALFVTCVIRLALAAKLKERSTGADVAAVAFSLVAFVLCLALCCPKAAWLNSELAKAKSLLASDYVSSEWFQEMTLDDLEEAFSGAETDDADYPLYIGRADCAACRSLEGKLEQVLSDEEVATVMPTYYTSEDREGERSSEMYELLDDMGVESVPCVMVVKDGVVLYCWPDPESELNQIKVYLETGELPSG